MSETGTSAPQAQYPKITEAPRSSDGTRLVDHRTVAPDQEYPDIVPAEPVVEDVCPTCGR